MFVRSRKAMDVVSGLYRSHDTIAWLTNEVEKGQPWDELQIEPANELLILILFSVNEKQ